MGRFLNPGNGAFKTALNNFYQHTMINPGVLAPYIGFTEEEVKDLCIRHGRDLFGMTQQHPGEILLIEIHYDKKSKEYACVIEKLGHAGNE